MKKGLLILALFILSVVMAASADADSSDMEFMITVIKNPQHAVLALLELVYDHDALELSSISEIRNDRFFIGNGQNEIFKGTTITVKFKIKNRASDQNPIPSVRVIEAATADEKLVSLEVSSEIRYPVQIGDIITFGHYPQKASGTDNTPIEWLVLARDGNKALLLSRYGLDAKAYNTEYTGISWEKCTLRTWLNDTFLNKVFTVQEQTGILLTNVDNSSSQGYWSTSGGKNTQDKIFLLSYAEANKYLGVTPDSKNTKSRVAPTLYAAKQGAYISSSTTTAEGTGSGWWWLRSPGLNQKFAPYVNNNGFLNFSSVNYDYGCVRPALWINLESDVF